jgi:hypothetical protein
VGQLAATGDLVAALLEGLREVVVDRVDGLLVRLRGLLPRGLVTGKQDDVLGHGVPLVSVDLALMTGEVGSDRHRLPTGIMCSCDRAAARRWR